MTAVFSVSKQQLLTAKQNLYERIWKKDTYRKLSRINIGISKAEFPKVREVLWADRRVSLSAKISAFKHLLNVILISSKTFLKHNQICRVFGYPRIPSMLELINKPFLKTAATRWVTAVCLVCCRGDRIRTCDRLVPNQERYRTALRPEFGHKVNKMFWNDKIKWNARLGS